MRVWYRTYEAVEASDDKTMANRTRLARTNRDPLPN